MRSIFVLLRDTSEAEVATHLDRTYERHQYRGLWLLRGSDARAILYITFYRDLAAESGPEEYAGLIDRFGVKPHVAVMAHVSGRIPGDEHALAFVIGLLSQFSGVAMDDYTEHLWSRAELLAGHRVAGHGFFDYRRRAVE